LGSTSEARLEVEEAPAVVCSVRMVVLWAMQALGEVRMGWRWGWKGTRLDVLEEGSWRGR
jgi:hypothetical protein